MWSTSWSDDNGGSGYCVGPKWGKFAECREDALYYAACEIEASIKDRTSVAAGLIRKWVLPLKENPETAA